VSALTNTCKVSPCGLRIQGFALRALVTQGFALRNGVRTAEKKSGPATPCGVADPVDCLSMP